jgi:hypothetical protein
MRCFLTLALLLLLLTFVGDVAGGPNEGVSQELFIRMDGGLLTIQAKEVPHRQILEELAKRLGVQLIVAGPLEERRSLELNGMPWENALKKALSPAGWAFVYERFAEGTRLAKVFVFPPGAAETSRRAVASAVARVPPRESRVPAQAAPGEEAPANPDQQEGIKAALSALVDVDAQATQALALVGLAAMGEGAVNAFVQALQHETADVREMAAAALDDLGGEQTLWALQQLLQDEDEELRKAAREAFGSMLQESR